MIHPMNKRGFSQPHYDAIIIGGGITGAAIAYELSCKGATVALVEKGDFGGGTSAATSKLIHGGLRYLKNFELGLVRESLKERLRLSNIAPNFVRPIPFMLPLYTYKDKWLLKAGMEMYDYLSFDKKDTLLKENALDNYDYYSAKKTLIREKDIRKEDLLGSYVYHDCQNANAERLTLSFIKSAMQYETEVANYAKVEDFIIKDGRVKGIIGRDLITDTPIKLLAKVVINCGGAWANDILQFKNAPKTNKATMRSEGIHIVTKAIGYQHAIALVTPKGRHVMVLPWRGHSIIGTTDKPYTGEVDDWKVNRESIEELIEEINACYGDGQLSFKDVCYYYGGLRPLVDHQTENTYDQSRKHEVIDHTADGYPGLYTVEGGKYTTSRHLAEIVGAKLSSEITLENDSQKTAKIPLFGCKITNLQQYHSYLKLQFPFLSQHMLWTFISMYGEESEIILKRFVNNETNQTLLNADGEVITQVYHAIENEMAFTLEDIFLRRTGLGTLGKPNDALIETVSAILQKKIGYSDLVITQQIETLLTHYQLLEED
ncbi:glycerol-3-phosphate dehydrogenase/oxidase [Flammeovirga pectinis]|nr:glycerol-3-phosphate dehydrogenase/oxidase [Flammeovirga pectinis]